MKKYKKNIYVMTIFFLVMQFLLIPTSNVDAFVHDEAGDVLRGIYQEDSADDTDDIKKILGNYLWVAMTIGMVTGVGMLAYIGIKFIISAPEGKADIKKQAYMYIIGALLIMSGSTFVGIIADVANTALNS